MKRWSTACRNWRGFWNFKQSKNFDVSRVGVPKNVLGEAGSWIEHDFRTFGHMLNETAGYHCLRIGLAQDEPVHENCPHQFLMKHRENGMTKKVLIIDAGCQNYGQGGTLSHAYAALAGQELAKLGWTVEVTTVDRDFDPQEEVGKVAAADVILVQTPGWWMSTPWQLKRYEDLVFVKLSAGDGRSRANPDKKYGTGGVLTDKHYLLSSTWNAPLEAFTDPAQFFEGRGIDGLFMPLHKTFEFLGVKPLASFMANDVIKNPTMEADFERFKRHLATEFGKLA